MIGAKLLQEQSKQIQYEVKKKKKIQQYFLIKHECMLH